MKNTALITLLTLCFILLVYAVVGVITNNRYISTACLLLIVFITTTRLWFVGDNTNKGVNPYKAL